MKKISFTKRILSLALCLVMVLGMPAVTAFAEDKDTGNLTISAGEETGSTASIATGVPYTYDLWVGGIQVTSENADSITTAINNNAPGTASGTAMFNPETNTLALLGFTYTGAGYTFERSGEQLAAAIYSELDTLNIIVNQHKNLPNCSLTNNVTGKGSYGIFCTGNLVITGNRVSTEKEQPCLTVQSHTTNTTPTSVGIYIVGSDYTLTVNECTLIAKGGNAIDSSVGVWCPGCNITVGDNAKLTGESGEGRISYGIASTGTLTVNGGTVEGTSVTGAGTSFSLGIGVGRVTSNSEENQIIGMADSADKSAGIFILGDSTIYDGYIKGATNSIQNDQSHGILFDSTFTILTIKGGTVIGEGAGGAFDKAPVIDSTFSNACIWYGDTKTEAEAAGAKHIGALEEYYYQQKYVRVSSLLTVTLPSTENQIGYTIAADKETLSYKDTVKITINSKEGYGRGESFAIYNNGVDITDGFDFTTNAVTLTDITEDVNITIAEGSFVDIVDPNAEITVGTNKWNSFLNTITFGFFFNETQGVTITATDKGSCVKSIQSYLSDRELELDEVRSITSWIDYNGTFKIDPDNNYVVYAKVTDNDGNVAYINSEGIVLDATVPVLYGIEDGGVYHGDKIFKAIDDNFLKIEVDGVDITNTTEGDDEFKIAADNAHHTVTVTDKAGNVTEYKITVYKKYMVTWTDGEGGSYEKNFNYGEVITIPANEFFDDTFRKTGYTVKEWQGYTEGMTMPLENLTFTAVYVPCEYTVTFDPNGGEEISSITVTFGEKYGSLPSSAITGLSGGNKNWYLVDADGNVTETNIRNLTLVSTARDHKLFIKRNVLAPSVSIALTVPGGISDSYQYYIPGASNRVLTATVGNMNTDVLDYTYQWYKDGTLIEGATSSVLTLDGNVSDSGTYKVEVTATLKDGTNIVVTSNTATASKEQKVKILHASNTLSYDANGGEGGPQSSYTGGTSINVSKEAPTREHYIFIGWNTAPDGTGDSYKAEDAYTFANDNRNGGCVVTLYAQWKLVEYTVTYVAGGEAVSTEMVGHGKDATLPGIPAKDGYVGKWDSDGKNITEDTTISVVYTEIPAVKADEVKPEDKSDLEDAKAKLEEMLEDDSYTDDDKKDIQDAIGDIDDALEVIGNVEAVAELIGKLPENITKKDEDAIKAADDAYNALSDYEKSLVDEAAKKALTDAKAALAELNKPADPNSPATGDNSNMFLWIALLFISGGALITMTVVDRKRRSATNK